MTQYAQCGLCGQGDLLPFYGEEGSIAYFCTNCRSRFSGYEDPALDGRTTFADRASYSPEEADEEKQDLFEKYKELFRKNPPYKGEGRKGYDPEDPDLSNLYLADMD